MSLHAGERLSAFLDGELPDDERREVQAHLDACASCRERLLELGLVDETARGLDVQAPDGYFEALPGRIRQRLRTKRRPALPVWGLAAAAALLVAVLTPVLRHVPLAPRSAPAAAPQAPAPPAPARKPTPLGERPLPTEPTGPIAALERAPHEPAKKESRAADRGLTVPKSVAAAPFESREELKDVPRDSATAEAPVPQSVPGFAAPPAPAPVAATPAPTALEEEKLAARTEADQASPPAASGYAAGGSLAKARRKQDEGQGRADETKRSMTQNAGSRSPKSAEEARTLREDWRRRAIRHPAGPEGDDARVGTIEAGAQAYRLSGDPEDLEILRRDADAYLVREDARHAERVREVLRAVEDR